jgi:class 3 adenylate cyclase/YHS domain-containing protein
VSALTVEDLSRFTGEPAERLEAWRQKGLLGGGTGGFRTEDIEAVRLIHVCLQRGISIDSIVEAESRTRLIDRYIEMIAPNSAPREYSLADAAEASGLDLDTIRRLWTAGAFAADQGETLGEDDIEAMDTFKRLLDAGFPISALEEGGRVYADSLARVAEMESKLFHFYIHKRLQSEGLSGEELMEAVNRAGDVATPTIEPTLLYFHRKAWERAIRDDWVLHVAEEAGLLKPGDVPGQLSSAVVFIDLSSFTPLTDAMGDTAAADVLDRFSSIVRGSCGDFGGRVVKQIGDAFMLVFMDARSAVACSLEIDARVAQEPQFPAIRAGIQWGDVLYRDGDYVGSNVNIASRLASEADRHQVLVTADVRREAAGTPGIEFVQLGKRTLKGLGASFELFAARSEQAQVSDKHIDPVCGMEMSEAEVAARLTLEGEDRAFCSEDCLRKFIATPDRYATSREAATE